tara:strand:- start:558 stop:707 length:150 start_codon:yes stop_codon:yes gene_type:complete
VKIDMAHYIAILKKHEETRASTNDRKKYWKDYAERQKHIPKSQARFEHG